MVFVKFEVNVIWQHDQLTTFVIIIEQDLKSAWLIVVCKRTLKYKEIFSTFRAKALPQEEILTNLLKKGLPSKRREGFLAFLDSYSTFKTTAYKCYLHWSPTFKMF